MSSDELVQVKRYMNEGLFSPHFGKLILDFYNYYVQALGQGSFSIEEGKFLFQKWITLVAEQIQSPHQFDIFHQAIRAPFDYYQFGLLFISPLIDFTHSQFIGIEYLNTIEEQIKRGENVILFANHQTEPDSQILSLFFEIFQHPDLASNMIFVAGHRVISDPMAVPLSMGCNLLCIYSKKHIDHLPGEKADKIVHNQRTMKKMADLLTEGGACIYVAPSGGRDRANAQGFVEMAAFNPDSVEMFRLMAKQAKKTTHFYPLALKTYDLMPPPSQVAKELGEPRLPHYTPIHIALGEEINFDSLTFEHLDKQEQRSNRAQHVWQNVYKLYQQL